jgi:hypothetical protein
MINLPDLLGVQAVDKVTPVLSALKVADTANEADFRAAQLVKGQSYYAQILSRADDKNFYVKVQDAVLKMDLGSIAKYISLPNTAGSQSETVKASLANAATAQADVLTNEALKSNVTGSLGQTLLLKYVDSSPVPTFMLLPHGQTVDKSEPQLSLAGKLIDQQLREAEKHGVSTKYIAGDLLTNTPHNPQQLAEQLKSALTNSGLFYESHLKDFVEGQRTLQSVQQEPQNQPNAQTAMLMAHQLAVLENQRLIWRGEVWPGQLMEWDVHQPDQDHTEQGTNGSPENASMPIASEVTLHLPYLGKVTAKLNVWGEHVKVQIVADNAKTAVALKTQAGDLSTAFEVSGQVVEGLTISTRVNG